MAIYYIDPVLAAAAIIPAVVLLIKVYKADRLEKEPVSLILSLVFFGVLSTAIAMVLEQVGTAVLGNYLPEGSVAYNAVLYFGIVAFSEEGAKYLLLKKRTWWDINFNCQFDGVVYGVSVSLGFALWENLGYVAMYGFGTALVRAVTAVPGHACFGVFRGDHAENEQRDQKPRRFLFQPVGTVDLDQQYHRRDHRRGDQHGIHFAYGRQHSVSLSLTSCFFLLYSFSFL